MRINQEQRLSYSKKNKQWRVNQVDYLCSRADEFSADWIRMWGNYRLLNNQLDQEEYREYCDTLGLNKEEGKKFVEPFNKTHNIINSLKGEEEARPWNYSVINLSPNSTNEVVRKMQVDYQKYIDKKLEIEVNYYLKEIEAQAKAKAGELPPGKAQQALDEIKKQKQAELNEIFNPEQIRGNYSNYRTSKEMIMQKLLKVLSVNQNIKFTKNETFTDAAIAGIEAIHIKIEGGDGNEMPTVKQVNPLNIFFHKSPDSPFIHQSDYVGYKEELTIGQTLDLYGDKMHPKDRERLYTFRNKIYGTDTPFSSKNGESQSNWGALKQFEYGYNGGLGIPNYGSNNVMSEGLYNSRLNGRYYDDYVVAYTVYWKSQRKVGIYRYTDEYGEMQETIVAEEFTVPKEAKTETYQNSLLNRNKKRRFWYDQNDNYHSIEWIWVPEVWTGTRLNGDIYVDIHPYQYAYQSLLNPYKVKLPIYGYVYNSRNTQTISIMDRMKPWQQLYYVVMSKWLKLIAQDKGVISLLNVLFMDKKLGYEKTLQIAVDHGFLPWNPLAHSQGNAIGNTYKPAERLDLSNAAQIAQYTSILQFIEQQLKVSAGVNDQRLAQTSKGTNVTDNQRDTAHSMNITSSIFSAHDLLWQEILQGLLETAVMVLDGKSGYIREILSDEEVAILDMGLISIDDEYTVRVANNIKAHRDLEMSKQLAHALIQNDKMSLSVLLDLMTTDNMAEFRKQVKGIEKEIEDRDQRNQEQQQKAQQEHEEKMLKLQREEREDQQAHDMDLERLRTEGKIKAAEINAFRFQQDLDSNDDGIPDPLQVDEFKARVDNDREKIRVEEKKIMAEEAKADREFKHKDRELELRTREAEAREKELNIRNQEKIKK